MALAVFGFESAAGNGRLGCNGERGLYFVTEREGSPWVPEFSATSDVLDWFLESFCFADATLSREEAKKAFTIWFFQQFFPGLRRTRIIPTFLGPQGSGKTTGERLVGQLLLGPSFDVTGIQREREDAFVAAVTNRVVLGLDNADSKIPWLADSLALYATGQRYRLRKLYTTNEEVSYVPRAILMISSRDPQFNRPDVSERLLPIHCERPERYFTEAQIFDDLQKRRGAVMGALLNQKKSCPYSRLPAGSGTASVLFPHGRFRQLRRAPVPANRQVGRMAGNHGEDRA